MPGEIDARRVRAARCTVPRARAATMRSPSHEHDPSLVHCGAIEHAGRGEKRRVLRGERERS